MALSKPLDDLHEDDFQGLLGTTREGLTLEFKSEMDDLGRHEGKREFLADVTSFANASGGHIVYGIGEENGEAARLAPMDIDDPDALEARLHQIIDGNVEPKLTGFQARAVAVQGGHVVVLRVPHSWNWPHGFGRGQGRLDFWIRSGVTKRRMDIDELRAAFVGSAAALDQAEAYRQERTANHLRGEERPVALSGMEKLYTVVHLVPLEALTRARSYDLRRVYLDDGGPKPLGEASPHTGRPTIDGILTYAGQFGVAGERDSLSSYLLLHRDGRVETVGDRFPPTTSTNLPRINGRWFDLLMARDIQRLLCVQAELEVPPPIWIGITLFGVRKWRLEPPQGGLPPHTEGPIDREPLLLPAVIVEDVDSFTPQTLRPSLDAFWNSAGYRASLSFDPDGDWLNEDL